MAALRILLLTFISHFVIEYLSIYKVIIFSAIATDDRQPLWSCSIHQMAEAWYWELLEVSGRLKAIKGVCVYVGGEVGRQCIAKLN